MMLKPSKNLKNSLIVLTTLISFSSACFAEDAKYLTVGTPAPYSGFLFTVDKTKELREQAIDSNKYKLLNESLEKSLKLQTENLGLQETKVKLLVEQNDNLSKSLMDARSTSDWTKVLWFSLGIIATGAAVYGASKITTK